MRTGANEFFYLTRTARGLETAPRWRHRLVEVPAEAQMPTVRRQADLDSNLHVGCRGLTSVLLNLRGWATTADREAARTRGYVDDWWDQRHRQLPASLSAWISEVAATPLKPDHPDKTFPTLTAVAPNIREGRAGEPLGYWYQIPPWLPVISQPCSCPACAAAGPSHSQIQNVRSSTQTSRPSGPLAPTRLPCPRCSLS